MEYVKVLLPSISVGLLFWYVIRSVVRADSIERREMDRFYAENDDVDARPDGAAESTEPARGADPEYGKDPVHGTRDETRPD